MARVDFRRACKAAPPAVACSLMAGIGIAEIAIIAIIGFLVIGVPLVVLLFVVLGKKRAS